MSFEFKIGGRKVNSKQFFESIQNEVKKKAEKHIESKLKKIRDPETGRSLKVKRKQTAAGDVSFEVEGSEKAIEELKKKL